MLVLAFDTQAATFQWSGFANLNMTELITDSTLSGGLRIGMGNFVGGYVSEGNDSLKAACEGNCDKVMNLWDFTNGDVVFAGSFNTLYANLGNWAGGKAVDYVSCILHLTTLHIPCDYSAYLEFNLNDWIRTLNGAPLYLQLMTGSSQFLNITTIGCVRVF